MPGGGEILVILILVLLLFGPDKLPTLARQLGRGVRELNKMKSNLTGQFNLMDDESNALNSSTRKSLEPLHEQENGWESYAARRAKDGDSSSENARDEDDIAEDFAPENADDDWRSREAKPTTKTENAFTATTLDEDFPVAPGAVARGTAPNKMRPSNEI